MSETPSLNAPTLVGYNDEGKPRMRVSAGWTPYRGIAEGNQYSAFYQPQMSGKMEAEVGRATGLGYAQEVERNSDLIRGALDRKANNVVGPNLLAIPMPDLTWLGQGTDWGFEYRQQALSAFQEWGKDSRVLCDAEGHYDFGGLMWQGFRTLVGPDAETGGYIGYDRDRADRYNHKWATYVHLIDPARISNPDGKNDGDDIYQGRQLDELGRMIGLHISKRHPSEGGSTAQSWEYIPRETEWGRPMAFHWFFKRRAGMQRAVTSLIASLRKLKMLEGLDNNLLETAATNAMIATWIQSDMDAEEAAAHLAPLDNNPDYSAFDLKLSAYDKMNLRVGNKRIPVLPPGDSIKMENLKTSMIDSDAFRNAFLRNFASAIGVSFEQLSLDYSLSSYSSTRSSIIEATKQVMLERAMFTNHVATLVYSAVIEEAFALNILRAPRGAPSFYEAREAYTRVRWIGPGMGWVDPLKEAKAKDALWALGAETLDSIAGSQGFDAFQNIEQKAMEIKYMESLGVPVPGVPQAAPAGDGADQGADDAENTLEDDPEGKPDKKKRDGDGDGVVDEKEDAAL